MERGLLDDLVAFAAVARTRNFTRAAPELGLSTSALSYSIKRLETRLGVRLLQRNSRSVAPTAAGERLLQTIEPAFGDIGSALNDLGREHDRISGTVRLTATRQAYEAVIRPIMLDFSVAHPGIVVEVLIEYEFRDIIGSRLDAGIRMGEKLEQDMIALSVGPELRMAVVASPEYLATHSAPTTPDDLRQHRCIGYRMRPGGASVPWEFGREGRDIDVKVQGPLVVNEPELAVDAALDGLGLAYVLEDRAAPFLAAGRLIRLLENWTQPFAGFFLYYPSRRQLAPPLEALIATLRKHCSVVRAPSRTDRK